MINDNGQTTINVHGPDSVIEFRGAESEYPQFSSAIIVVEAPDKLDAAC